MLNFLSLQITSYLWTTLLVHFRRREARLLSQLNERAFSILHQLSLSKRTLQLTGTISLARYPGWCPFGRSSKSTSHSTTSRTPLRVFLAAIIVPPLRSTTARGVLTHTLSPCLTFFIYPPLQSMLHIFP